MQRPVSRSFASGQAFLFDPSPWRAIMPAMRFFMSMVLIVPFFLALPVHPVGAEETTISEDPAPLAAPGTGDLSEKPLKIRLDTLFRQLKRERDAEQAKAIAGEIRLALTESDSASIDLLMGRAANALTANQTAAAFDYLDQVILLRPDYPEGWNLRATLHFSLGNNRKSIEDIKRVLALEPRHLGALSGLAGILASEGKTEAALKVWEAYLKLYPTDRNAQDQMRDLLEKLAGSRT